MRQTPLASLPSAMAETSSDDNPLAPAAVEPDAEAGRSQRSAAPGVPPAGAAEREGVLATIFTTYANRAEAPANWQ